MKSDKIILIETLSQIASFSIFDERGIRMNGNNGIVLNAKGPININGEQVFIQAPDRVLMQTSQSNIEIAKNFNIFSPNGTRTTSTFPHQGKKKNRQVKSREDQNHWQLAYSALGAIPEANLAQLNQNSIIDFASKGAVPKIAKGQAIVAMNEVMSGKRVEGTSHPKVFSSLGDNFSMKGGLRVPQQTDET